MENFDMSLTLEPVFANIIKSLAEFFGTTTDAVMANAPMFLRQYGWYSTLSSLGGDLIFMVIIAGLIGIVTGVVCFGINDELFYTDADKHKRLNPMKCGLGVFMLLVVMGLASELLPAIIAPEMVGLDRLLTNLTGKNIL